MPSRAQRPFLVAVSPLEQQRETLALVLEPDFEVATSPFLRLPAAGERRPAVVVLSLAEWSDRALRLARSTWPAAALVLVDPPPELQAAAKGVEVASWEDPLGLQRAVARALLRWLGGASPENLAAACHRLASLAQAEIGSVLLASRTLGLIAASASSPSSRYVAARALGEQLRCLEERLAWVEAVLACGRQAIARADLVRSLEKALIRSAVRFACRLLPVEYEGAPPFPLSATEDHVDLAAHCLMSYLSRLGSGALRIGVDPEGALVFEHPGIHPERETLALLATRLVFERLDVSFRVEDEKIVLARRN